VYLLAKQGLQQPPGHKGRTSGRLGPASIWLSCTVERPTAPSPT
jgi:hypothetical protein